MPQISDSSRDAARQEFIRRGEDLADALSRLAATVPDTSADIVRIDELGFCDIPRRYAGTEPGYVVPGLPEVLDPSATPEEINRGLDELLNELIGDPESDLPTHRRDRTFLTDPSAIYRQPVLPEDRPPRSGQCRIAIVEFAADTAPVPFEPGVWKVRPGDPVTPDTIIGRCRQERVMKPMKSIFRSGVVREDPSDGGFGRLFKTVNSRHIIIDCIEYCENGSGLAGNELDILCPGGMARVEESVCGNGGMRSADAVPDPVPGIRISSWEKAMSSSNLEEFKENTLRFTEEMQLKAQDINTPFSLVTDPLVYSIVEFAMAVGAVGGTVAALLLRRYEKQRDREQEILEEVNDPENIRKTEGEHTELLALGSVNMKIRDRIMADAMFVCEKCILWVEGAGWQPLLRADAPDSSVFTKRDIEVKSRLLVPGGSVYDPRRKRIRELKELAEPVGDSDLYEGSMMKEFRDMMDDFIEIRTRYDDEGNEYEIEMPYERLLKEFRLLEDLYRRARNAYFENHVGPDLTYLADCAKNRLWTQSTPCVPDPDGQSGYDAVDPGDYLQAQIDWNPPGCPEKFEGTDLGEEDELPLDDADGGMPEVAVPEEFVGKDDPVGRFMKKNGLARGYAEWPEKKDFELDGVHYDLYTFQNIDDWKRLLTKDDGGDRPVACPEINLNTSADPIEPEGPVPAETWTGGGTTEDLGGGPAPAEGAAEGDLGVCPDRPISENLSGMTEIEITDIRYWIRYCGIATLMTLGFLATGLVIVGVPVYLPCIYIPIYVTSIPKVKLLIVIGIAIRGISISPMIIYVNMSSENNSAIIPVTLALMMVKDQFMEQLQKLNLCVPDLADGISNMVKADNARLMKEQERYKKSYAALRAVQLPSRQMIIEYFKESANREMEQQVERATDTYNAAKKEVKKAGEKAKGAADSVKGAFKKKKKPGEIFNKDDFGNV